MIKILYQKTKSEYKRLVSIKDIEMRGGFIFLPDDLARELIGLFDLKYILEIIDKSKELDTKEKIKIYDQRFRTIFYNFIESKHKSQNEKFINAVVMNTKSLRQIYDKNREIFDNIYNNNYDKNDVIIFLEQRFKKQIWKILYEKNEINQRSIIGKNSKRSIFNYYNNVEFNEQGNVVVVSAGKHDIPIFSNGIQEEAECYEFDYGTFSLKKIEDEYEIDFIRSIKNTPKYLKINNEDPITFINNINNVKNMLIGVYNYMKIKDTDKADYDIGLKDNVLNKSAGAYISKLINIETKEFTKINPLIYSCIFTGRVDLLLKNKEDNIIAPNITNVMYKNDENINKINKRIKNDVIYAYNYFSRLDMSEKPNTNIIDSSPSKVISEFWKDLDEYHNNEKEFMQIINNLSNNSFAADLRKIILYSYILHVIINATNISIDKYNTFNVIFGRRGINPKDISEQNIELLKNTLSRRFTDGNKNKFKFSIFNMARITFKNNEKEFSFTSCGETAIMNIINYILIGPDGRFNVPERCMNEIKEFYKMYPTIDDISMNQIVATEMWTKAVSNIKTINYVNKDDLYSCELRSLPKSMARLLNILIPGSISQAEINILNSEDELDWAQYYNIIGNFMKNNDNSISVRTITDHDNINNRTLYELRIDDFYRLSFEGKHSVFEKIYNTDDNVITKIREDINMESLLPKNIIKQAMFCNDNTIIAKYQKLYNVYMEKHSTNFTTLTSIYPVDKIKNSYADCVLMHEYFIKISISIYTFIDNVIFKKDLDVRLKILHAAKYYQWYNNMLGKIYPNLKGKYSLPNADVFGKIIYDLFEQFEPTKGTENLLILLSTPEKFLIKFSNINYV